jgi:hypothetical protein
MPQDAGERLNRTFGLETRRLPTIRANGLQDRLAGAFRGPCVREFSCEL